MGFKHHEHGTAIGNAGQDDEIVDGGVEFGGLKQRFAKPLATGRGQEQPAIPAKELLAAV